MKKNLLKFIPFLFSLALFPSITFAADGACSSSGGVGGIICQVQGILNSLIPVFVSLGVVYFVWGVVQYVISDSEEAKKKGKDRIIYGIIGLAVIVSLWGLVRILVTTFGLENSPQLIVTPNPDSSCSTISSSSKFQDVLCYATSIINNSIIPLIFALAGVMFVWGVVNFFILNADQQEKRAKGKQFMIWGVIALTVMLAVWGLVGILGSTFGIRGNVIPQVTPPGSSSSPGAGGSAGYQGPCPNGHNINPITGQC